MNPIDESPLDLDALCRLAGVGPDWVRRRVAEGQLTVQFTSVESAGWRFDAVALHRVQRLARLERDYDADPELAALVADLEAEVQALRARVRSGRRWR